MANVRRNCGGTTQWSFGPHLLLQAIDLLPPISAAEQRERNGEMLLRGLGTAEPNVRRLARGGARRWAARARAAAAFLQP